MRIAHFSNSLQLNGTGHTNSTLDLAIAQAADGHSVTLYCAATDEETRDLCERHHLQIVDGLGGRRSAEAQRLKLRANAMRQFDVYHFHTVRSLLLVVLRIPMRALSRSVATLHNPHQKATLALLICRRVVVLSKPQQQDVVRLTFGLKRPVAIKNGTAGSPRLAALETLDRPQLSSNAILFVGALHRRKGLDVLLYAMRDVISRVPQSHLYVVGNRDALEFEELSASLMLTAHVTFVGFDRDPRRYMLASSVFVLPSREEGFGNVLTEARECKVPIVASRVGGIPTALADGRAGLLVEPGDPALLADALVQVLTDKRFAKELANRTQLDFDELRPARAEREYDAVYLSLGTVNRSRRIRRSEDQ